VGSWKERASSSAEYLLRECAPIQFPVDLIRLAVRRRILRIHFRPLPCDGAIEVVPDGFVVHLKSNKEQLVPVTAVDSSAMSSRQRFTLAHELSHTFFYDSKRQPIKPHPRRRLLESACNYGALHLLLPRNLLQREIGLGRRFDSVELACDIASTAQVSIESVLQRVDELEELKESEYALMAFRRQDDDTMVTTAVCLSGTFTTLPRPIPYTVPPKWVQQIVPDISTTSEVVHRLRYRDRTFVSRRVTARRSAGCVLVESRVDRQASSSV